MDNFIKTLAIAFILIVIGVILIGATSQQTYEKMNRAVANQSINMSNYYENGEGNYPQGGSINTSLANFTLTNIGDTNVDCLITDLLVENETGIITITGNYSYIASNGRIDFENSTGYGMNETALGSNFTNISYTYCPSGYMASGVGRAILPTIPGISALAMIGIGVFLIFNILWKKGQY